jgi:glycosyltransferase involved in cell wall biosynthesis
MIEIVSATRQSEQLFWGQSPLGISLRRLSFDVRLKHYITFNNSVGIGEVYNHRINAKSSYDVLVFIHDDVWIDDFYLVDHILHGLEQYDIIGVAGNLRRVAKQPSWAFIDDRFTWDEKKNLSGAVAHGAGPFGQVTFYGNVPATCEILDGVFLAGRRSKLNNSNVSFDPIFKFHFYDLDFCRAARQGGLRLGTWPFSITHQSGGSCASLEWRIMYVKYLEKWKD